MKGKLTQLQESFISYSVHLQCTSATHIVDKEDIIIRRREWDKGAFGEVHVKSMSRMSLSSRSISSEGKG